MLNLIKFNHKTYYIFDLFSPKTEISVTGRSSPPVRLLQLLPSQLLSPPKVCFSLKPFVKRGNI